MRKCVAIMAVAAIGLVGCGEEGGDATETSAAPATMTENAGATGGGDAAAPAPANSVWTRAGRQADKSSDDSAADSGEKK